jgi:hypothetical protein
MPTMQRLTRKIVLSFVWAAFCVFAARAYSQTGLEETLSGPDSHETGQGPHGHLFGEWGGKRTRLLERGVRFDFQYISDSLWKLRIQAFTKWSHELLEQLANRTLDAAVILLPAGSSPPPNLASECIGSETFAVVASKARRFSPNPTVEELSSSGWILNPRGCLTCGSVEAALLARRLPFTVAVETEGFELQLSLVSKDVGLGIVMPQVFQTSGFRKQLRTVKVKDFRSEQSLWSVHSRHIGKLAPVVRTLRDAVKQSLHIKSLSTPQQRTAAD